MIERTKSDYRGGAGMEPAPYKSDNVTYLKKNKEIFNHTLNFCLISRQEIGRQ